MTHDNILAEGKGGRREGIKASCFSKRNGSCSESEKLETGCLRVMKLKVIILSLMSSDN